MIGCRVAVPSSDSSALVYTDSPGVDIKSFTDARTYTTIWGADPGLAGAVAAVVVSPAGVVERVEWAHIPASPYRLADGRRRNEVAPAALYRELFDLARTCGLPGLIVLEQVGAMPRQGVASMFSFGRVVGQMEALLALYGPVERVRPAVWKPAMNVPQEKLGAVRWAREWLREHWPAGLECVNQTGDDGLAEALGLAVWGLRRKMNKK